MIRSCGKPRNRTAAHIVAAADLRKRLVAALALKRLALLVRRQLRFAPELDAASLGAGAAFASAGAYQLALELGGGVCYGSSNAVRARCQVLSSGAQISPPSKCVAR